jgi:O-antigen/teichoic acid export membrane protein
MQYSAINPGLTLMAELVRALQNKSSDSLLAGSIITLVSRALLILVSFLSSMLIARGLGPNNYGIYSVFVLILTIPAQLGMFGIPAANIFLGARNPSNLRDLAGNSIIIALLAGFVIGAILITGVQVLPALRDYLLKNAIDPSWLWKASPLISVLILLPFCNDLLRAAGHIIAYNMIPLVRSIVWTLSLAFLFFFHLLGLGNALVLWAFALLTATFFCLYLVLRYIGINLGLNVALARQSLGFGLKLYPSNIAQLFSYRIDVFIITYFLTPQAVGFYVLAVLLVERLLEIPDSIRTVLMPRIASSMAQEADIITSRVMRIVTLVIGLTCLLMILLARPIILILYGDEYSAAVPPLIFLLPGIWMLSLTKVLAADIAGRGHPEINSVSAILSLAVNIGMNLLLIPRLGIVGASLTSSLSYSFTTVMMMAWFLRHSSVSLPSLLVINRSDIHYLRGVLEAGASKVIVGAFRQRQH